MVWALGWAWLEQSRRCQRLIDLEAERRARAAPLRVVHDLRDPA
jgi:hypothetical protein